MLICFLGLLARYSRSRPGAFTVARRTAFMQRIRTRSEEQVRIAKRFFLVVRWFESPNYFLILLLLFGDTKCASPPHSRQAVPGRGLGRMCGDCGGTLDAESFESR